MSREEHKSIYSGLRIIEMVLSSQSDLMRIFGLKTELPAPRNVTYRNLPSPASQFAKLYYTGGSDETSSIKSSSGDERYRLVVKMKSYWTSSLSIRP